MKEKLKKLMPTKRKLVQLYLALLFNANLKGFVSGRIYSQDGKVWCAPGINCYSCPGAVGACPLGSLQGSFSADRSTIYYVGGILLLYAILFGRMICGWACPFGLIEELLYKIKSPKLRKSPVTRILSFFKYAVLVLFVLIVPIAYGLREFPLPAFCKYICPIGTIEGGLGLLSNKFNESKLALLGPLFTWKFMLMVSIVVGSIFIFRLFCRFICPLGAFYGLFNRFSVFGVKVEESKCTHCNLCISHCKVDIRHVGDQECINCGECIDVCPTKAIYWKGPKLMIRANDLPADATQETKEAHQKKQAKQRMLVRTVTTVVMLAVLIGAFVYYWNITPPLQTPTTPPSSSPTQGSEGPDIPVEGNQVGNLCYGYDLPVINGQEGETVNPIKTGKITVINFWGITCGPCIAELPYFHKLAEEYADSVTVIAVHNFRRQAEAAGWVEENYPETNIKFTLDYDRNGYFTSLGGTDTWPMTVILDENGVVIYTTPTSVHYEDLEKVILDALEKEDTSPKPTEGNQVGNLCYGYDLPVINGEEGETINPIKTGKITVINFWGTKCMPCLTELPYFDQIATEYADSVTVIAVHYFRVQSSAAGYVQENYPNTKIKFTLDYDRDGYYSALGGRDTWPMTVILDENGVVIYTTPTSVHYEDLQKVIEDALKA